MKFCRPFFLGLCLSWSMSMAQSGDPIPFPKNFQQHPQFTAAESAYKVARYSESSSLWLQLISKYPDEGTLYMKAGLAFMQLQNYEKAVQYMTAAYDLDPFNPDTHVHLGMLYALSGDAEGSKNFMRLLAITGRQDEAYIKYQVGYLNGMATAWTAYNASNATILRQNVEYLQQQRLANLNVYQDRVLTPEQLVNQWTQAGQKDKILQHLDHVKNTVTQLGLPKAFYHRALIVCANVAQDKQEIYKILIQKIKDEFREDHSHLFIKYRFYQYITSALTALHDYESCLSYNTIISEDLSKEGTYHFLLVNVFIDKIQWLSQLNRKGEGKQITTQLEETALQYQNPFLIVKAYEALCIAFSGDEPAKAIVYGERGLTYSKTKGVDDTSLRSALMVAYDKAKMFDKASSVGSKLNSLPVDSENQGTLLINQYKYGEAIPLLEQAFSGYGTGLSKQKTLSERYSLVEDYYRTAQKLAFCYTQEKKHADALQVIEKAKGSILAEKLHSQPPKPLSIPEIQKLLEPDDALVYFIESIYEGEFMAYVVTQYNFRPIYIVSINGLRPLLKNYNKYLLTIDNEMSKESLRAPTMKPMNPETPDTEVVFNKGEFNLVVELFRRTMNPSAREEGLFDVPKTFNQISRILSQALMNEVYPDIALQKRLIIVPDGALNFIPFEALKTPLGKFIIEKFDVSYVASASVLSSLKARQYTRFEKSILAMGGAVYNETTAPAMPLRSMADLEKIHLKVLHDIEANVPLQYAYASLGYGKMNYLPGTLSEVQNIKTNIPGAETIIGEAMNEAAIKSLSTKGVLNKYRVLHFATHGWVSPLIDELTGIAMTIPVSDAGGEDGYLTKSEAEQLKIKADVVMLSACQTALGKQINGEGVVGLSQAFLTAGANATISTLWPVNDYATSILVSELYKKVFNEKISFASALNEVKRNFIRGMYNSADTNLTAPIYWAPFIYSGKR